MSGEDFFGAAIDDAATKAPRHVLAVSAPAVNGICLHLSLRAGQEIEEAAPTPFIEEDGAVSEFTRAEYAAVYGEELSGPEILALRDLVCERVSKRYRKNILLAAECGPSDGNLMSLYIAACEAEHIDPMRELIAL